MRKILQIEDRCNVKAFVLHREIGSDQFALIYPSPELSETVARSTTHRFLVIVNKILFACSYVADAVGQTREGQGDKNRSRRLYRRNVRWKFPWEKINTSSIYTLNIFTF